MQQSNMKIGDMWVMWQEEPPGLEAIKKALLPKRGIDFNAHLEKTFKMTSLRIKLFKCLC